MQDYLALATGVGFGVVAITLSLILARFTAQGGSANHAGPANPEIALLLDHDGNLIDATPDARDFIGLSSANCVTWEDIRALLLDQFPDLPAELPKETQVLFAADETGVEIRFEPAGGKHRLTIAHPAIAPGRQLLMLSQANELGRLSSLVDLAPNPVWSTDEKGKCTWNNAAYAKLKSQVAGASDDDSFLDMGMGPLTLSNKNRVRVNLADGSARWFEVASHRTETGWAHFATDIDTLIEAELAQRNFVQTLTKTFAHLPIGLAVFDRERRLVLFNPALVDLTCLPVDFLSARPNLFSFFDHMRDNRMMPEPKNYASWREQLNDVISAARDDRYCETWSLSSGLTYKITGRPHPDGAVAFLLEDISAEISLTRRFRSELELTQSVVDTLEDAVAVFSRVGVLTSSNTAYRTLWDSDPDGTFTEMTIADTTREWKDACEPSPIWAELRDFVLNMQDRKGWSAELTMTDGRALRCFVEPVSGGATMVRFSVTGAKALAAYNRGHAAKAG